MTQQNDILESPKKHIFDCFLFNGEMDLLSIRINELNDVVDTFVIIESTMTFSGMHRYINFNPNHPNIAPFAKKIRHIIVADMPDTNDPWVREKWQRNAVLRGLTDATPTDLIILSDIDEIPRASVIAEIIMDNHNEIFGFRLLFYYFYVNYQNISGPQSNFIWNIAATRQQLEHFTPDALRYAVRDGSVSARIFDKGGWHFSYLMDETGVKSKIASFSHQELNNEAFLKKINIPEILREKRDLFDRPNFVWEIVSGGDLPLWLQKNRHQFEHFFYPVKFFERFNKHKSRFKSWIARSDKLIPPIIICPYLYDHEASEIRSKFRLDHSEGSRMEFFLWQDKKRIGVEFAFEFCWNQFPDRDIIIIHSDMAPMPGESVTEWYDALLYYRERLPDAGMIACNLFYPNEPDQPIRVQCAGGTFENNQINHIHGRIFESSTNDQGITRNLLNRIRPVEWVTFGGVLIRRTVINACGSFDRRYLWAYYMDVDYCFEARLRGFHLFQVPVSLQHEESRSTRSLIEKNPELKNNTTYNLSQFNEKWADSKLALPSIPQTLSST